MSVDFFVHPEYVHPKLGMGSFRDGGSYNDYIDRLISIFKSSELPILIKGQYDFLFEHHTPKEQIFQGRFVHFRDGTCYYGSVLPKEWTRFKDLISQYSSKDIRVHGVFLGYCVDECATQVFGLLEKNSHWWNWIRNKKSKLEALVEELLDYEDQGEFLESNIRFGTVISPTFEDLQIAPNEDYPFGNTTHQFSDEQTYSIPFVVKR